MKILSLRMRLTLVTVVIIIILAFILTGSSIYNASSIFKAAQSSDNSSTIYNVNSANESGYAGEYTDQDTITIAQASEEFNDQSIMLMCVVIVMGGFFTYFALGYALRPVHELSEKINSISEHDLYVRIDNFQAGDEINRLADSFNMLLSRLEKAFHMQKSFASAAAHELKTPLAAIKTSLDVLGLEENPSSEEYAWTVQVAEKQTERMIKLVNDLFTMSMQHDYSFEDNVDLNLMLQDILWDLQPQIEEKQLTTSITDKFQRLLPANAAMLYRALANLVENAVKYNVKGGSVEICLAAEERHVSVRIADSGIGISQQQRERIFEPFYRVDTSRSRKTGGAGLGLAIAKDTIERHGGQIGIESNGNQGTVFVVRLPI